MLHRRCLEDDGKGMGEELDEIAYGKGLTVRSTVVMLTKIGESTLLDTYGEI